MPTELMLLVAPRECICVDRRSEIGFGMGTKSTSMSSAMFDLFYKKKHKAKMTKMFVISYYT